VIIPLQYNPFIISHITRHHKRQVNDNRQRGWGGICL